LVGFFGVFLLSEFVGLAVEVRFSPEGLEVTRWSKTAQEGAGHTKAAD
jgi:hypothetical protein